MVEALSNATVQGAKETEMNYAAKKTGDLKNEPR